MKRAREFKAMLQDRFGALERIGAYLADLNTHETEEAFTANPDNDGAMFRAILRLGNGSPMYEAENCADYVLMSIDEQGARYGFHLLTNPSAASDCYPNDRHVFALLRSRFIVDIWISLYAERASQVVLDLQDKADHETIQGLYGDPALWLVWDSTQHSYLPCELLPEPQRPKLGQHLKLVDLSIP